MPNRSPSAIRAKAARQGYRFFLNHREPYYGTYTVADSNRCVAGGGLDEDDLERWFYDD